jgi:hypothetical protein
MSGSVPFRLNRSGMLLALISAAFAGEAAAAAGRVDFTTPGVTVAGRDGQARPLAKGTELDSGDTVRTNDGRAQIRFTDGSYVSLQPNTDFAISDYKYDGKDDDRGFFGLVKGAMRTVTGAVGRTSRNSYRITTPTATVGIRGTGGVVQVLPSGATLVIGTSGIWSLTNPAGSIDIPAGVSGLAPTQPNTPPTETNTQPQTSTAPVQTVKTDFKTGDEVDPEGKNEEVVKAAEEQLPTTPPTPPIVPLVSGPGYAPAAVFGNGQLIGGNDGGEGGPFSANAVFNSQGQLTELAYRSVTYKLGPTGRNVDFGTDGILAWGRWVGPVSSNSGLCDGPCNYNFGDNEGLHYVIGTPTPVMPLSGGASYSVIGATRPTDGSSTTGSFSGTLSVSFGTQTVIGNFGVTAGARSYSWTTPTMFIFNSRFAGTTFSGEGSNLTGGSCAACGCSASVTGFFAGANAERAGLSYHIQNSSTNILGAAAFKRNP